MAWRSIVGLVGLVVGLASGTRSPQATFTVVGVYIDETRANDDNMHVVGTWAMNIALPVDSSIAQVQAAAQTACGKGARRGWRCAEMGEQDLDVGKRMEKPCAAVALGVYSGKSSDGVLRPYTLWPLKFGFPNAEDAIAWGHSELKRLSSENNNDPLLREVSISTNCSQPSS